LRLQFPGNPLLLRLQPRDETVLQLFRALGCCAGQVVDACGTEFTGGILQRFHLVENLQRFVRQVGGLRPNRLVLGQCGFESQNRNQTTNERSQSG
jgi:hypothetical protein